MEHKFEVSWNPFGGGYLGSCETCSDPDWVDDGWSGQVVFHGDTVSEVEGYFEEHVAEVEYA